MLVLALDTATPAVTATAVSVLRPHELLAAAAGGDPAQLPDPVQVLSEWMVIDGRAHVENLMPLVTRALAEAGKSPVDLEAVVVGLGPGPFTGLRVGIATAAALGDALDLPVHGVPTHDGFAAALRADIVVGTLPAPAGPFAVVTDARRREVYLSVYDPAGTRLAGPVVLPPGRAVELATELGVVAAVGTSAAHLPVPELPGPFLSPVAGLVRCRLQALLTGVIPGPLTPLYLRAPDAAVPAARKSVLG